MSYLIVYSTKYGTTEECAKKLGKKLNGEVEYINLKQNKNIDLSSYNSVIIGAAVYAGAAMKEVNEFIEENKEELKSKVIGLFTSGMNSGDEAVEIIKNIYPDYLYSRAKAIACFGGKFKFSKMNLFEKAIIKMISKKQGLPSKKDENNEVVAIEFNKIEEFADKFNK